MKTNGKVDEPVNTFKYQFGIAQQQIARIYPAGNYQSIAQSIGMPAALLYVQHKSG